MRILFLSHRLPYPPTKGDKLRTFNEIQYLARRHQIHLLTFEDPDDLGAPDEELRRYCSEVEVFPLSPLKARLRCLKGLLGPRPLTTSYFDSSALAERVQELAVPEKCDVLVACGSGMAHYAELAPQVPRLLDMVDVDSVKWYQYSQYSGLARSFIFRLEARRLSSYESGLGEIFDKIVLTTESEVSTLESISPGSQAKVVRNGVNLGDDGQSTIPKSEVPALVFTGQMDYFANVDGVVHFSKQVLPRLKKKWPELRFVIVGRSPTAEVKELEMIPGVTVTGEVEDVRPFLSEAWVFVAPLRIAQGVQNKVLEAMAEGIPAVVSERVMAGLADGKFQDGRDLMVATDDLQLEKSLDELLRDERKRLKLATKARSRLAERYCWEANMLALEHYLEEIAHLDPQQLWTSERESGVAEAQ